MRGECNGCGKVRALSPITAVCIECETKVICPECEKEFNLLDEDEAEEWYYGHDCEVS